MGNGCVGVISLSTRIGELVERAGQNIILYGHLAGLRVEGFEIRAGRLALGGVRERFQGSLQTLALSLGDLVRLDVELLGGLSISHPRGLGGCAGAVAARHAALLCGQEDTV